MSKVAKSHNEVGQIRITECRFIRKRVSHVIRTHNQIHYIDKY